MVWLVGIDEAGYGPNLGPFVMTAVACQVPAEAADRTLWDLLSRAVRKGTGPEDGRLVVDDSKAVYSTDRGLEALERGVLATLWHCLERGSLDTILTRLCPDDRAELAAEVWFTGATAVPLANEEPLLRIAAERFHQTCADAAVGSWHVRSSAVCPARFNRLLDEAGTKGAILSHTLAQLLRWALTVLPGEGPIIFAVDKHGGRNAYAAQIQAALPESMVISKRESLLASVYEVLGLGRKITLTFQARADQEHFCVSLASMTSKYLRELFMKEFNVFWQQRLPELKATAGYPGDAARFYAAIKPIVASLGLDERTLWRRK